MTQNIYVKSIMLLLFCINACNTYAQVNSSFSMPLKGEEVFVSQGIDPGFLGIYQFKSCQINLSRQESYILHNNGRKDEIVWGVLLDGNQPVKTEVREISGKNAVVYQAFIVVVYNTATNNSEEWLMYELDTQKHFGEGLKTDMVASNK